MVEAQGAQMQKLPLVMISGKNSLSITHSWAFSFGASLACRCQWYPLSTQLYGSQAIKATYFLGTSSCCLH